MGIPYRISFYLTFMILALGLTVPGVSKAEVLDRNDLLARAGEKESAKDYVLNAKAKIAQERNAIIAARKRLDEAKKTKDKALIEKVKEEVDKEIKDRKIAINALYNDIKGKIGQTDSFIPGRKDRAKR
ncbi:MAG: hypothetical protein KBB52_00855 [Candidatus Omnitrophica bacterium]|nr:hypothetical protein [Candidatus Omnitrophota bacterium]